MQLYLLNKKEFSTSVFIKTLENDFNSGILFSLIFPRLPLVFLNYFPGF